MTLALMRCCATSPLAGEYEAATDLLLARLGVQVQELDFNCCGYPLRNSRFDAYVLSSARNLALAERARADLVTACSCCFGNLSQVGQLLQREGSLRESANASLANERLECSGSARVRHLLQVLRDEVGLGRIREERRRSLEGLKVACHYGCHLLRPGDVTGLDDPASPSILDELVEATGAESVAWGAKLDCCGSPAFGVNEPLSVHLTERKLRSARDAGADVLCVVCPYCHLQFDRARTPGAQRAAELPTILFQQLLGLSLGVDPAALGVSPALPLPPRAGAPHA